MIIVAIMPHRIAIALLVAFLSTLAVSGQTPAPPAPKQIPPPPDVAAPPPDAEKTATGLASKVITPASGGETPKPTDLVTVHYTGWTTQGRMFDSSHARGKPNTFSLDRVFPGWRECVGLMRMGETRRCWIPQELAYKGQAGRPAGMLVFDVELLDVIGAPPDVKAPPSDAKRTVSGLAYKVLRPGTGTRKPSPRSEVTVHYTGWTTDGKRFDSSVARGTPTTFGLDQVIKGWTEGVGLMVEGEKTRFWIPQDLAYKGQAGSPRGMLVFDIELIRIER
jgi:FKBP-type peptidyl-prolyl cis-trans isomerase